MFHVKPAENNWPGVPENRYQNCVEYRELSNSENTEKHCWKKAEMWVDSNIQVIRHKARQYMHYSPYELDDFIQIAYIAAYRAAISSKGPDYHGHFWNWFRNEAKKLINKKKSEKEGSIQTDSAASVLSDMSEEQELEELLEDRVTEECLRKMSEKERIVWSRLLEKPSLTDRELAKDLGYSCKNAINRVKNTALRRISEKVNLDFSKLDYGLPKQEKTRVTNGSCVGSIEVSQILDNFIPR